MPIYLEQSVLVLHFFTSVLSQSLLIQRIFRQVPPSHLPVLYLQMRFFTLFAPCSVWFHFER